jgi:putative FmdB family regulatory protein
MRAAAPPPPSSRQVRGRVPTYDYECRSCGHRFEVIHSMLEDGPTTCERCEGPLRRVLHPAGIIFRGSGFYSTDSRSSQSSVTPPPSDGKGSKGGPEAASSGSSTTTSSDD